jgi:hypothetical protein
MNCPEDTNRAIDARRFPRYEIDTEVDVATVGVTDPRVMRGRSLNISNAGLRPATHPANRSLNRLRCMVKHRPRSAYFSLIAKVRRRTVPAVRFP